MQCRIYEPRSVLLPEQPAGKGALRYRGSILQKCATINTLTLRSDEWPSDFARGKQVKSDEQNEGEKMPLPLFVWGGFDFGDILACEGAQLAADEVGGEAGAEQAAIDGGEAAV